MSNNFPTAIKSWAAGLLPNVRISFTSLLNTMGNYISGIGNQLITKGYTCAGSSNGTTAAMDGTNRCTVASGFAVRAANTTTAQSWLVVTDASGAQTLFAYVGASDDIARISFSPSGVFTVAGTATFTPTATDEQVFLTGVTLIGSTASADRVYTVWVDSTSKMWRSVIFRSSIPVGPLMGVELYDSSALSSPASAPVPSIGFAWGPVNLNSVNQIAAAYTANTTGALARITISSVATSVQLGQSIEQIGNSGLNNFEGQALNLNGGVPAICGIGLWSTGTLNSVFGKAGNRIDIYRSSDSQACGTLSPSKDWVFINANSSATAGGLLLPWDSSTTSCVTS